MLTVRTLKDRSFVPAQKVTLEMASYVVRISTYGFLVKYNILDVCGDQISVSSDLDKEFEGTYVLMDSDINGKVAYEKDTHVLSYNPNTASWNIKDLETILAWGLNHDGVCPQGSDETWHIEPKEPYTGFTMTSGLF